MKKIGKLEQRVKASKKVDNEPTRSINFVERKIDMNKLEWQLDNFEDDMKNMKVNEKNGRASWQHTRKGITTLVTLLCVRILGINFIFQNMVYLKGVSKKL